MEGKFHNLSIQELVDSFETNLNTGLTENKARKIRKKVGKNSLPEEKPLSRFSILMDQFKSPLVYILVIAGIICLFIKEWADAFVIWIAIFLDVIIGFFQEKRASNILRKLKKVLKTKAIVIRDGKKKEILQQDIVPGDIFILKPGQKVPADARIFECNNLQVNEAPLTGEWLPAEKHCKVLPKETHLADRENMVYMGTVIEDGQAKAITVATGIKTEIGKVAKIIRELGEEPTLYQRKLARFSKIVGIILALICVLIFAEGIVKGRDVFEMFEVAIAVAVSAIPEGLPVAMIVILALAMQRILRKKGLVRRLSSAETLGTTSVIATDKTLTLTEGKMEIVEIFGKKNQALKIAALCSEAIIENPKDQFLKWKLHGRPTDRALILGAAKLGFKKPKLETWFSRIDILPFNNKNKFIATLYKKKGKNILFVSGAPERILNFSKLKRTEFQKLNRKLEQMASKGYRVIAIAQKTVPKSKNKISRQEEIKNMEFIGFIGLNDPLRKEAKKMVSVCKKAGIRVILVTGDHILTAKAVAKELKIPFEQKNVILGQDLDNLSDKDFQEKLKDITVYARAEPSHKLRIIDAWQQKGEVVAMTGDGINDAPALKKADIGVALGSGTEVAKEASDLILLNDRFSTIITAIEEGRAILDNIRKVITYLLSDSFAEVILVSTAILTGVPLPITAPQILWVNLIEDGLPDIALAFEPKEKGLMKRGPEPGNTPLLNKEMRALIFIIGIIEDLILLFLFFWLLRKGYQIEYIRTMIFAELALDTVFASFACKDLKKNIWQINIFSNKLLIVAAVSGILMLALAIYFPPLQFLLETVPLALKDWLIIGILILIDLILIEYTKHYFIVRHQV